MHIHLLREPEPTYLDHLIALLDPSLTLSTGEVGPENSGAVVLVGGRPSRDQIEALPNLEALIVPWTGIPPETMQLLQEYPDLSLHNLHHNAAPTAEMAVTLMLAAAKRLIPFDQGIRENDWRLRYQVPDSILVSGKTALILGYGEIGQRIGSILDGFGINIIFIRRNVEGDESAEVHPLSALNSLLPGADFLILALPLTGETEELIGENELSLLPSSAILVNVARGGILDEGALFRALNENLIFAAGLDVWFNYPKSREERGDTAPGNYPWGSLDNLVLSPHRGALVRETEILRMEHLAELLNQAAQGYPIPNRVDPDLGY